MKSESRLPFDQLLAEARVGNESAISQLVRQYEREVRTVARARLGIALQPHLDSMDLVQSVHRSLLIGLRRDRFDISTPEQLIALATTIVRRKAAQHWRRIRRQQGPNAEQSTDALSRWIVSMSSPESDPARIAEFNDEVAHVLGTMNENDRSLVQLRMDGYSTAGAARQLGLDIDTSRVRLFRLRKRLAAAGLDADIL